MAIEVDGLRKLRDGRAVLDGVSFSVARGERVVLMGPSGAGKTTLLRCLNGLERADAGTIRVGGHEIRSGAPDLDRQLVAARRRVGLVFQQWNLFANRTVLGNVIEAPIHVAGVARAEAVARARGLLARVGVGDHEGRYPHELSGGEQQRVAIARALAMQPEALLLDEPTSALDRARADELLALLVELAADGLALVVVAHDARVPERLGARVLTLDAGRLTG